jgi:hypothetical protein
MKENLKDLKQRIPYLISNNKFQILIRIQSY